MRSARERERDYKKSSERETLRKPARKRLSEALAAGWIITIHRLLGHLVILLFDLFTLYKMLLYFPTLISISSLLAAIYRRKRLFICPVFYTFRCLLANLKPLSGCLEEQEWLLMTVSPEVHSLQSV